MPNSAGYYPHGLRRMTGRLPHESHRAATPLELLFDLTFVAAFGVAGGELAHGIAAGHAPAAALAFGFAMIAIIWAWINFSWFASAFDTDDWLFRLMTLVQMAGVVILAIGLPQLFASLEHGEALHTEVMVAGYVVMRVSVIAQWWRAAHANPQYRGTAKLYALLIGLAQLGWVATIVLPLGPTAFLLWALAVTALDWLGPVIAEAKGARHGGTTPWHAHHLAERFSLLAIIALGETVFGTLAAAQAITAVEGWSVSTIMVIALGAVMTFALWWVYFMVPGAPILAVNRTKVFPWVYGHIPVYAAIAAVGAGLHVLGYLYDDHFHVSTTTAIAAIALPVLLFMLGLFLLHTSLVAELTRNGVVQTIVLLLPLAGIGAAALGWPMWSCLLIVALSPTTVVLSFELGAWRSLEAQLSRALAKSAPVADAGA